MKLITSKRFIGELIEDINVSPSDYLHRLYGWIDNGLELMGLTNYYPLTADIASIENKESPLPCDLKYLHSLWVQGESPCGRYGLFNVPLNTDVLNSVDIKDASITRQNISVVGNYIKSPVDNIKVLVIYRAVPKDEEGFPLVPDNAFVSEALRYYIIYRLGLKGIEHPVIRWDNAYQQWERLYPRAANDVNWFTSYELEDFNTYWQSNTVQHLLKQI